MKAKVISLKHLNIYLILINIIAIVCIITIAIIRLKDEKIVTETIVVKQNLNKIEEDKDIYIHNEVSSINLQKLDIPKEMKYKNVIGKLEIEKIGLTTYILGDTTKETLNISVTKLYGPEINKVGNVCIIGHNYNKSNMFGKLKKLEINDVVKLTDLYNQEYEYKIYEIQKVKPEDTSCLSQDTNGERKITLITCTTGALKRLIIKAHEIYD